MSNLATTTLRYLKRSVTCRAPAADVAWLEEFLSPWFTIVPEEQAAWRVERKDDPTRLSSLLERGLASEALPADAFGMDRGMQQLPAWSEDDGTKLALDRGLGAFYRIIGGTRIEVGSLASALRIRVALMRVVRELAMSEVRQAGRLLVHGAALGLEERGVLIAGPKRAGKTTLLIHSLLAGGTFVSNDRVVLESTRAGLRARGMPSVVSVRQATLDPLPELSAELASGRYDHLYSTAEIAGGDVTPWPRPGRPRNLSAAQLCALVEAPQKREVVLDTLLLLRTGLQPGVRFRELPRVEAGERLAASLFGNNDRNSQLFPAPFNAPSIPTLGCQSAVESLRCLDVELGMATSAAEIVRGLERVLA